MMKKLAAASLFWVWCICLAAPKGYDELVYAAHMSYVHQNFEQALQQSLAATALDPLGYEAAYYAGISAFKLERLDDAESQLRRAKKLAPNHHEVDVVLGYLRPYKVFLRTYSRGVSDIRAGEWASGCESVATSFEGYSKVRRDNAEELVYECRKHQQSRSALRLFRALHPPSTSMQAWRDDFWADPYRAGLSRFADRFTLTGFALLYQTPSPSAADLRVAEKCFREAEFVRRGINAPVVKVMQFRDLPLPLNLWPELGRATIFAARGDVHGVIAALKAGAVRGMLPSDFVVRNGTTWSVEYWSAVASSPEVRDFLGRTWGTAAVQRLNDAAADRSARVLSIRYEADSDADRRLAPKYCDLDHFDTNPIGVFEYPASFGETLWMAKDY